MVDFGSLVFKLSPVRKVTSSSLARASEALPSKERDSLVQARAKNGGAPGTHCLRMCLT